MAKYNYTQPANELQRFANMVEFPDAEPTENSAQLVTSGGVYDAIQAVEEEAKQLSYNSLMEDTASGSIASFPDGAENVPVKELTADIEPIQDLHGQASPYPPNGGKNKLPLTLANLKAINTGGTWTGNSYSINGVVYTVYVDAGGNVISITANGTVTNSASQINLVRAFTLPAGSYIGNGTPSGSNWRSYIDFRNHTQSQDNNDLGSGVSFSVNADDVLYATIYCPTVGDVISNKVFYPMLRLSTEADATFAPYSNICPIEGYTGAEIPVTGINVWDEEWELGGISIVSGNPFSSNSRIRSKNLCPIKGGQNYYYKGTTHTTYLLFYRADESFISALTVNTSNVIAVPEDAHYFKLSPEASYGTTYNHDISINYPSTDTDYHSGADNKVYSVSWSDEAGTVYGGNLNATTGVLTIDYPDNAKVDLGAIGWTREAVSGTSFYRFATYFITSYGAPVNKKVGNSNIICDAFATETAQQGSQQQDLTIKGNSSSAQVYIRCDSITDAAAFQTAMSGIYAYYEPTTAPITVQLTPTEVQTLLGDNNMWSDTGDISVKYRCNTALYIEKKLGE